MCQNRLNFKFLNLKVSQNLANFNFIKVLAQIINIFSKIRKNKK